MERREKIALFFWLFLSLFVCIESYRLGLGKFTAPGPGFLTFGISIFLITCATLLLLKERGTGLVRNVAPLFRGKKVKNVIYSLGLLFAYALLLDKLGFVICTLLFMGFSLKMIEPQKWKVVLAVGIGVTFISYLVFIVWLQIQIPEGKLMNQVFSLKGLLWK